MNVAHAALRRAINEITVKEENDIRAPAKQAHARPRVDYDVDNPQSFAHRARVITSCHLHVRRPLHQRLAPTFAFTSVAVVETMTVTWESEEKDRDMRVHRHREVDSARGEEKKARRDRSSVATIRQWSHARTHSRRYSVLTAGCASACRPHGVRVADESVASRIAHSKDKTRRVRSQRNPGAGSDQPSRVRTHIEGVLILIGSATTAVEHAVSIRLRRAVPPVVHKMARLRDDSATPQPHSTRQLTRDERSCHSSAVVSSATDL